MGGRGLAPIKTQYNDNRHSVGCLSTKLIFNGWLEHFVDPPNPLLVINFADKCVLQSAFYKVLVIDSNVVKIFRDFFVDSSTHLAHFLAVVCPQALHRVDLAVSDGFGV